MHWDWSWIIVVIGQITPMNWILRHPIEMSNEALLSTWNDILPTTSPSDLQLTSFSFCQDLIRNSNTYSIGLGMCGLTRKIARVNASVSGDWANPFVYNRRDKKKKKRSKKMMVDMIMYFIFKYYKWKNL